MSKFAEILTKAKADGKLRSKRKLPKNKPSASKAAEMLRDGTAHGKPLTDRQQRFFGYLVGRGDD